MPAIFSDASKKRPTNWRAFRGLGQPLDFTPAQERWLHDVGAQIRETPNSLTTSRSTTSNFRRSAWGGKRYAMELFGGEET